MLSAAHLASNKTGLLKYLQVLGHGLPGNLKGLREDSDRLRSFGAQLANDCKPRGIPECGEDRKGIHLETYFCRSKACSCQPMSLALKACARRSAGIWSKPDSAITTTVPPSTSVRSKVTSVIGSEE